MHQHDPEKNPVVSEQWIYHRPVESFLGLEPVHKEVPTRFLIKNESLKIVFVYWVNELGVLTPYIRLNVDECREQQTFATHSWVVTDENLKTLSVFTAGTKQLEQITIAPACESTSMNKADSVTSIVEPPFNGFEWLPEDWELLEVEKAGEVKSFSGLCSTRFSIQNTSAEAVKVLWVNYEGQAVPHIELSPGESEDQLTWATHPWLVQTNDGRNLLLFVAGTEQNKLIKVS